MKRKTEIYVKAVAFMQVAAVACTGLTETVSWQGESTINFEFPLRVSAGRR